MTIEAVSHSSDLPDGAARPDGSLPLIHPRWVRITHWINALAMFMMIGSGWQIYDASPLFKFLYFPRQIALGEWLAGADAAFLGSGENRCRRSAHGTR